MYNTNLERLNKIKGLRDQGLTIDQIAIETGYPRSSVGHYVRKYCEGRNARENTQNTPKSESSNPTLTVYTESKGDRVEAYLDQLARKERLTVTELMEGKKRMDAITQLNMPELLRKNPILLYYRLMTIKEMIRLAPFLKIDINDMRDLILLYLSS